MTRAEFDALRHEYCTPAPGVEDPDPRLVEVFAIAAAAAIYVEVEGVHTLAGSPPDDGALGAAWATLTAAVGGMA